MTVREFCRNKTERIIFRLSLLVLFVSLLLSLSIYATKVKVALSEDIKKLESVRLKINRSYELKRYIDRLSAPQLKPYDLLLAQLIDNINARFPEVKIELSERKREGQEIVFPFLAKGDGSFQRYMDLVAFFGQQSYPACFVKNVSLKAKENSINLEIKGEIRIISHDSQI